MTNPGFIEYIEANKVLPTKAEFINYLKSKNLGFGWWNGQFVTVENI